MKKINYNLHNNLFILLLTDCNMIINIKNGGFGFYE